MIEITKERLQNAGWTEDRKISMEQLAGEYENHGFVLLNCVKEFLEEFGMLEFRVLCKGSTTRFERVNFNLFWSLKAANHKDYLDQIYEDYSDQLDLNNMEFYPVGETVNENLILLMSNNGKFIRMINCSLPSQLPYGVHEILN